MTISELVAKLEAVKVEQGDVQVSFANYMEESVIAHVTSLAVERGQVVLDCEDGGELSEMEEDRMDQYGKIVA